MALWPCFTAAAKLQILPRRSTTSIFSVLRFVVFVTLAFALGFRCTYIGMMCHTWERVVSLHVRGLAHTRG